jgi:NAD(P)-dependent dehydrogenase (short-subunit alcohol dehydrogenase family)
MSAIPAQFARCSIESEFGGVDILVNNAGIMPLSSIADTDEFKLRKHEAEFLQGGREH